MRQPYGRPPRRPRSRPIAAAIAGAATMLALTLGLILVLHHPASTPKVDKGAELITALNLNGIQVTSYDAIVKVAKEDCKMNRTVMGFYADALIRGGHTLDAADIIFRVWCPDRVGDWMKANGL